MGLNEDLIDRLGKAALEAKEVIREAHGVQKDLERAVKEARQEIGALAFERLDAVLRDQLKLLVDETRIEEHSVRLNAIFRQWTNLLGDAKKVLDALETEQRRLGLVPSRPSTTSVVDL